MNQQRIDKIYAYLFAVYQAGGGDPLLSIIGTAISKVQYSFDRADVRGAIQTFLDNHNHEGRFKVKSGKTEWKIADIFDRDWITGNSVQVLKNYGSGELTLRGLHYQLVALGMTNTMQHYKRVVQAMIKARWDGVVSFTAFSDHDRETIGFTRNDETVLEDEVELAKDAIKNWMESYSKNRWENQKVYLEVWIEKKALIGVFERLCGNMGVLLFPCKGYPSLTLLNEAANRFKRESEDCIILYFGDYDASGENIPQTIHNNLRDLGAKVEIKRILLHEQQVIDMSLPPAPTKVGDPRAAKWDGIGQVELDAVQPNTIREYLREAIDEYFDEDIHRQLKDEEEEERKEYQSLLKDYVIDLADNL